MNNVEKIEGRVVVNSSYGEALKHEVVKAILGGLSYRDASKRYGIRGHSTMAGWVKKYGGAKRMKKKSSSSEAGRNVSIGGPDREKLELERALGRMSLKVCVLETVIEEAGKYYKEDLKKKFSLML